MLCMYPFKEASKISTRISSAILPEISARIHYFISAGFCFLTNVSWNQRIPRFPLRDSPGNYYKIFFRSILLETDKGALPLNKLGIPSGFPSLITSGISLGIAFGIGSRNIHGLYSRFLQGFR